MDFRTTVVKTLLNEEVDSSELISEETLSLMEDNPFDTFSDVTLDEMVESGLVNCLEEVMSKQAYVSAVQRATDPDNEKSSDSERIIARAKKHHGDKFAKDLEKGANSWHYPKEYKGKRVPGGYDNLKDRKVATVTKSGKADKRHIQALKSTIKRERDY